MNPNRRITAALACATSGLLGSGCSMLGIESAPSANPWKFETAALLYAEPERVKVFEAAVSATRETDSGGKFAVKGVFDALTGASATGAVASNRPQTFSRPSGNGNYTVAPGKTPLDDTFHDTRVALGVDWENDIVRGLRYGVGLNVSNEYDYRSIGLSGRLLKDLNDKNTTLSLALSVASDTINPVGGVPTALARMGSGEMAGRASSQDKTVTDLLLGVTQIIDARSLFQVNYGLTRSSGYHTDPYKLVSLVDDQGQPFDSAGTTPSVVFEKRPDSRTRHALYARYKRLLASDALLDVSYRFTTDDWGIRTHTIEGRYRFPLADNRYVQPRLRLYSQGAADFYRGFLRQGEAAPQYASADYRLGKMNAYTLGVEYGWGSVDKPWRLALDYYSQRPSEPDGKFGQLLDQRLSPAVNAVMLRVNKAF